MKAFIDDFKLIRIESNEYIFNISIDNYHLKWYKNENGSQYFKVNKDLSLHEVDAIFINNKKINLEIGLVTLRKEFEKRFRYDGNLGYQYNKEYTEFYIFSPVAKEIHLIVNNVAYQMEFISPIWYVKVLGNLEGLPYYYNVRLVDRFIKANDPYNIASNKNEAIIIDKDKLYKLKEDYVTLKNYNDAIIYEAHVRDLTIDLDVKNKGKFDGITEYSKTLDMSVLEYIKKLGITHLELLPVFDFYGVNLEKPNDEYNWGYNPMQYFAIQGWFSKDYNDPYLRINEFLKLIDEAHKLNIGIIMDVVYNHVYERWLYPYDIFVPGYFYRHDKNFKPTKSAFLDNDLETTNYMVRKLIIDSLVYFTKVFKIDGFRFDLMGLMDVSTMNQIRLTLKQINPSIILFGEGWNMDNALDKEFRSNMDNENLMPKISHFNDFYRNTLKGELHTKELGYASGNKHLDKETMLALIGSPNKFNSPEKSINYIECHDNMTFYDKLSINYTDENIKKDYQDLGIHLTIISQGVPFIHAGMEMYRTKFGIENSYNSPDSINKIRWKKEESVDNLIKLIRIRKKYGLYRLSYYDKNKVMVKTYKDYILYTLTNKKYSLSHFIKNDYKSIKIKPLGNLIFNSKDVTIKNEEVTLNKPGVYIFYKEF